MSGSLFRFRVDAVASEESLRREYDEMVDATVDQLSRLPTGEAQVSGAGTTLRAGSQAARIVAVLRDGLPHTTAEIHAVAGFSRLNSRAAELRARGYVIECERVPGAAAGPHAQTYRLLATPDGPLGESGPPPCFPSRGPDSPNDAAVLSLFDEQAA